MESTFNFDLDDTARRIGHLVLRIWQLEEENKRALSSVRLQGEKTAPQTVEALVADDKPGNGAKAIRDVAMTGGITDAG